jgi:hypothetical protein
MKSNLQSNRVKLLTRDYDYCFEKYETVSLYGAANGGRQKPL